jgi:hypothetical protein
LDQPGDVAGEIMQGETVHRAGAGTRTARVDPDRPEPCPAHSIGQVGQVVHRQAPRPPSRRAHRGGLLPRVHRHRQRRRRRAGRPPRAGPRPGPAPPRRHPGDVEARPLVAPLGRHRHCARRLGCPVPPSVT